MRRADLATRGRRASVGRPLMETPFLFAPPRPVYFLSMKKNYVLDANILLHDPASIYNFADNTVVVPVGVLTRVAQFGS